MRRVAKGKQPKEQFKRSINRSAGGDFGVLFFLLVCALAMSLPVIYAIGQSFKPLDELWLFPPHFFPNRWVIDNFVDLFRLMGDSWVPFSRYIFNTVFITAAGVFGNLFFSSLAAYALSKIPFPGRSGIFKLLRFFNLLTQHLQY